MRLPRTHARMLRRRHPPQGVQPGTTQTRRRAVDRHRLESEARNAQEHKQIRRNGEVDPLAKMATRLHVPDYDPQHSEDIAICGGPTPTPARKWILQRRRVTTFDGVHWVSGLAMRRDRHMLWVKWLGRVRWDGTGAPWDHTTPKGPPCPLHLVTTVHKRLIRCMRWKVAFRNMWLSTWGPWQDAVTEWWNRASAADRYHVSCLRIPRSIWDHIPRALPVDLRERVAWHQYHALQGVCQVCRQFTMPPRNPQVPPTPSTTAPAWYTKLRPRAVMAKPHGLCPPQSSRVYRAPGENIAAGWPRLSRGISPQSNAHVGSAAVLLHQVVGSKISRPMPLCHCLRLGGAAGGLGDVARPFFVHQRAVLGASLLDTYRDVLDDLVRQSRHWHSLLRRARMWTTSAYRCYQQHNRRVELFSAMSQLWASERAVHQWSRLCLSANVAQGPASLANAHHRTWPPESDESLSPLRICGG